MSTSSHGIDRIYATFDDPNLVAKPLLPWLHPAFKGVEPPTNPGRFTFHEGLRHTEPAVDNEA